MDRRLFLSSLATTGSVLVAGCGEDADGNSGSGGGTTTGDELVRDPAKSEKFAEHFEPHTSAAMDAFEEAVTLLKSEFKKFDTLETTSIDVQIEAVKTHLEEAATELSATGDKPYRYAFNRYIWGFQQFREWLLEVVEVISYAKQANEQWITGRSNLAGDQVESARDTLSKSESAGRSLSDRTPDTWEPGPDVAEYREWYDIEAFNQFDAWSASLVEALQPVGEWGDELSVLANGYRNLTNRAGGFPLYDSGKALYEKEEFEHAISEFESAKRRFESVEEDAVDNADQVADRFQSEYDAYVCLAGAMVDAAEAWRQATLAKQSGDEEATQEWIDEAERLRKSC